jgi:hypothetical protein
MNMNINEKEIEQASRKIDLSGFKMQDELNPKIWDKEQKMKPEVKKTLLKITDDYFESLDLPGVDIEDVTMTGSLANYNWSKYSDVDLHIVIDYDDLPMERDLVQDFLKSKSSNWNKEHDVKIYGYDVELYVQDINEPHHSTGVYSILNNEWNIEPEKKKISFSDKSVKDKANRLMDRVEEIYDEMDDVENEETVKRVDKLTEKIKKMRQSGLESGGEFSVENIVFKVLRRNGMLDRLYDIKTVAYDKSVTLESSQLNKLTESMSEDPLQWMKEINPTPIDREGSSFGDHGAEYDIVMDYFNKQRVQQEGEWKYSMDSLSGSIVWWQDNQNDIIFYATPFWNGEDTLPIDYQGDMGDYDTVAHIDLPKFNYKEELINWLENEYPQIVHKEIVEVVGDMGPLPESVNERLMDKIKKFKPKEEIEKARVSFKKFREAIKQEGRETKEAWGIISKAIKEKRKLTDEEEKKVKTQMGDLFKTTGLTIATFLPGGTLYLLLTRVPRFKKYLLPSAFSDNSNEFKEE